MTSHTDIQAPSVLLLGDPGNGKTFSLATMAKAVDKFFYLYTDPGGTESLIDALMHHDVPLSKVHWRYIPPASQGWDSLKDLVQKVNMMDYQTIATIKSGIRKSDHKQMFEIISIMAEFKCERTGEVFPPADEWPDTWGFAFDSLTGLNRIAKDTTVGAKPTLHEGEWNIAMNMEENFIRKVTADMKCPRVMIGHLDKTYNMVSEQSEFTVSLLGKKLAPTIPHLFSDVIHAHRSQAKFAWSTQDNRIALKTRNLPHSDSIAPDFGPLLAKWRARKAWIEKSQAEQNSDTSGGEPSPEGSGSAA